MTSPIVRFHSVAKSYDNGAPAIPDLDLEIEPGSFVTLLGPSGCGKSTTLRLLGGFEQADGGQIFLDGQDITTLPPEKRDVNMVFQDYALFGHLDVAGNVGFGLQMQGHSKEYITRRVAHLLDLVGLRELAKRKITALSGGQRQRVALARALAPDPKVLLLDEPLAALDAKLRVQMQAELKDLQRRSGKTFLFVTHDQEEALALSDRIIVMDKGRIAQNGTPLELYNEPASPFVADFIGASSQLSGHVLAREDERLNISGAGFSFTISPRLQYPVAQGERVTLYLRPENLCLAPEHASQGHGELRQQTFIGGRLILEIKLSDGSSLALHHEQNQPVPALGSTVHFTLNTENVIYFPK